MKTRIVCTLFLLLSSFFSTINAAPLILVYSDNEKEIYVVQETIQRKDGTHLVVLITNLKSCGAQAEVIESFGIQQKVPNEIEEWIEFSPDWSKYSSLYIKISDKYENKIYEKLFKKPRTLYPIKSNMFILNIAGMAKNFKVSVRD